MIQLEPKIEEILRAGLLKGILSSVRNNAGEAYYKVDLKPIQLKGAIYYHASYHYDKKVTHENIETERLAEWLVRLFETQFKQGMFYTAQNDFQILISKKGKATVIKHPASLKAEEIPLSHDRTKNYILAEGEPIDFLVHLGVMDAEGRVFKKKYDKFRQLNKYLEFVSDAMAAFESDEELTLIDFGCGKAYLTFALYYYLVKIKQKRVKIIGLDLKTDVIEFCNDVAKSLDYQGLFFQIGDIEQFEYAQRVDMVVSLHACDTATDAAIGKAVSWGARVIFAVPCCQHELFKQLESEPLSPLLKHGIVKDKLTTIVTDTLRAEALEVIGYDVQMLEFIDMQHTPKNILIRAYLKSKRDPEAESEAATAYRRLRDFWNVKPSIEKALGDRFAKLI